MRLQPRNPCKSKVINVRSRYISRQLPDSGNFLRKEQNYNNLCITLRFLVHSAQRRGNALCIGIDDFYIDQKCQLAPVDPIMNIKNIMNVTQELIMKNLSSANTMGSGIQNGY